MTYLFCLLHGVISYHSQCKTVVGVFGKVNRLRRDNEKAKLNKNYNEKEVVEGHNRSRFEGT